MFMYVTTKRFRFWTVKIQILVHGKKKGKEKKSMQSWTRWFPFQVQRNTRNDPKCCWGNAAFFSPSYFLIPPSSSSPLTEPREAEEKSIYHECDLQTEMWWNDSLVSWLCWSFLFNIFYDPFDSFHYLIIHNMKRNNLLIYPTQRDTTAFWSLFF